jgi:hypothetical protein
VSQILNIAKIESSATKLTFDEKSSKSLSLAIRKAEEAARRVKVDGAGENAAEYLSADAARVDIMMELKEVILLR